MTFYIFRFCPFSGILYIYITRYSSHHFEMFHVKQSTIFPSKLIKHLYPKGTLLLYEKPALLFLD